MIMVLVTIPDTSAQNLAKILLNERVCACVNIIKNVKSFFWWQGKIDEADESLLVIKTKDSLFARLKTLVEDNHPYDVAEIIAFKADNVSKDYLEWLNSEVNAA